MSSSPGTFKGTILDINSWGNYFNNSDGDIRKGQFKVVYYILSIILQIISFSFLFDFRQTEYIVYVFSFVVYCVSPFLWIQEFHNVGSYLEKSWVRILFKYKKISLYLASILTFLGIFLVILTNENIRKQKVGTHKAGQDKGYHDQNDDEREGVLNSLKTDNKQTEHYRKVVLILYTTVVTITWGIIGETFSNSTTFIKNKGVHNSETGNGFIKTLSWLLDQPHDLLRVLDTKWHNLTNKIDVTPMAKCFSLYCITFVSMFFGLFIRFPENYSAIRGEKSMNGEFKENCEYNKDPTKRLNCEKEQRQAKFGAIKIINVENIFTQKFRAHINQNRDVALFFISAFISLLSFLPLLFITTNWWQIIWIVIAGIITIVTFGSFFGARNMIDVNGTKTLIMVLLSIVFSLLGTPVVLGILQLAAEGGMLSNFFVKFFKRPVHKIYYYFSKDNNFSQKNMKKYYDDWDPKTLNTSFKHLFILSLVVFCTLLLTISIGGSEWFAEGNDKQIRLFNALLITMAVSLFIGLSAHYNAFTNLYKIIKAIIETTLVFVAPIGLVVLSLVLFIFAMKNHDKFLYKTDG
jgi:hypothetical protein